MGSPATAFSSADALTTALTSSPQVKTPQLNYPFYTPTAAPSYVQPVVNNAAPNESEFAAAQSMESQDYQNQALAQTQQASAALYQSGVNAYQTAFYAGQARETEASQYTSSGVSLQGSPLIVLEQTRQLGLQEVQAIQNQGLAQAQLGYTQATQTEQQGLATLLGQQSQFDTQVSQWGTQAAVNQIQSITQQQGQAAGYNAQNTAGIANAFNQRQPIPQVALNNSLAQGLGQIGGLFGNTQANYNTTAPNQNPSGVPATPITPIYTNLPSNSADPLDPLTGTPVNPFGG